MATFTRIKLFSGQKTDKRSITALMVAHSFLNIFRQQTLLLKVGMNAWITLS
jgi:hypothetical protein